MCKKCEEVKEREKSYETFLNFLLFEENYKLSNQIYKIFGDKRKIVRNLAIISSAKSTM